MKHTLILSASMFFSNALIMIFEIIGSRILGPYVGTSIIVWSSIIAIILFFISLGNYYGGKIADKNPNISSIHTIFLLVGIGVLVIGAYKDIFLFSLYSYTNNIWFYTYIVSCILFGPISFLLGMISPICMKLAIKKMETVGITVGVLSGLGAFGAIIGTLISGFFLIPTFGITTIIFSIGLLSLGLSLFNILLLFQRKYLTALAGVIITFGAYMVVIL